MLQWFYIKHASLAIDDAAINSNAYLQSLANCLERVSEPERPPKADLILHTTDAGLVLEWTQQNSKPLSYHLDYAKQAQQLRSFPAPKQGAFNQALGKKSQTIVDATGGWGSDALLMCLQGYQVYVIERLPLLVAMMSDAFSRLAHTPWARENKVIIPQLVSGNGNAYGSAYDILQSGEIVADCVYLDPMFPPKRKKSAATNKQMQLLQWLAGTDSDASQVADVAIANYKRLAVKRPSYAEPLISPVDTHFTSKLVHYDVYLNH